MVAIKQDNSIEQHAKLVKRRESNVELEIEGAAASDNEKKDQASDGNNSAQFPIDMTAEKEAADDDYIKSTLKHHKWYHGLLFGVIVNKLLKWENSYLVRRALFKSTNRILCISTRCDDRVFHYQLHFTEAGWVCPKLFEKFPDIPRKRYEHVADLLDAWSLVVTYIVPVPRHKMVICHETIQLHTKLGNGAFGEVFKATYTPQPGRSIEVAVKRVIGDAKRAQLQEFCQEARIMAILEHPNVVKFYGIASLLQPIMVVMEVMPSGDLKKYLVKTPKIPNRQILLFALDVSLGMKHLASKKVIHRDLAARNCLLTKYLTVKISDFGLSVKGNEVVVKNLKKAPIRWLAPETLSKGVFNERTDVWSFGVFLTELMTRCENDPLWPRDLKEVQKWIKEAEHPHRVDGGEPKELVKLVDDCCVKVPANRITFTTVARRLAAHCGVKLDPQEVNSLDEKRSSGEKRNVLASMRSKQKLKTTERKTKGSGGKTTTNRRKDGKVKLPAGME